MKVMKTSLIILFLIISSYSFGQVKLDLGSKITLTLPKEAKKFTEEDYSARFDTDTIGIIMRNLHRNSYKLDDMTLNFINIKSNIDSQYLAKEKKFIEGWCRGVRILGSTEIIPQPKSTQTSEIKKIHGKDVFITTLLTHSGFRVTLVCVDVKYKVGFSATLKTDKSDKETAMKLVDDLIRTAEFRKG